MAEFNLLPLIKLLPRKPGLPDKAKPAFLNQVKQIPKNDSYISKYWKIGLVEKAHRGFKREQPNGELAL